MTVKRIGPRLTLQQQLIGRQNKDRSLRGRQLAMQITTPSGRIMRASTVLKALDSGGPEALGKWMERVDKVGWDKACAPVDEVASIIDPIGLDKSEIYTVSAGKYSDIGGDAASNPLHDVTLASDVRFFPLTLGFLQQFKAARLIRQIENRQTDPSLKGPNQLVGWLSVVDALELLEIINPALIGDVSLRLPAETPIEVLLSLFKHPFNKRFKNGGMFLTASKFVEGGVGNELLEPGLSRDTLNPELRLSYLYRFASQCGAFFMVGKHWSPAAPSANNMNANIVFEVVDSVS